MGASGAILIIILMIGGAYCWWKVSHPPTAEQAKEQKSWRERMPWNKPADETASTDDDNDDDEFHDEETGTKKRGSTTPQKGWMDTMTDKLASIEIPSADSLKMMVFKNSLSRGV
jgi:hypothetical protein